MIYIDDSIMQKGSLATAGSKMLENFTAPFDATVITRLKENAENIKTDSFKIERVRMTEYGLTNFGLADPGELPGSPMLCNDVFGHVRRRAAGQGLCYIRPTYGTVSRYGLIPTASSMDQIGIICKEPPEGFPLLAAISGYDEKDGAMFPEKNYSYAKTDKKTSIADESLQLPYSDVYSQILQILAFAEISGNLNRYDGIKFGYRAQGYKSLDTLYTKTRTEAFGLEAKLAIVMGCLLLSQDYYVKYYEKAMKIRRLIKESLPFTQYDVITIPDDCPLAELAGLPSLTFSHNGKGIQLVADVKKESYLLAAWESFQL